MFQIQTKSDLINKYQKGVRDFQNTILTSINLTDSNLEQINLDRSNLIEINWSNCNLIQTSFNEAHLCLSNFHQCSLMQASLKGANLEQANLQEANLEQANLAGTNLTGANLAGANLKGTNLSNTNLERTCFVGAVYDCETIFDSHVDPEALKMVFTQILVSDQVNTNVSDKQNLGAVKKIFSWYRSSKLNLQAQDWS